MQVHQRLCQRPARLASSTLARRSVRASRLRASGEGSAVSAAEAPAKAAASPSSSSPPIGLTERAREHLAKIRADKGEDMLLCVGVKTGGCNGMSYTLELAREADVSTDDFTLVDTGDGVKVAADSKGMLYLFGLTLDFSDELIGGGFKFNNPNAESSCGCGKSFSA